MNILAASIVSALRSSPQAEGRFPTTGFSAKRIFKEPPGRSQTINRPHHNVPRPVIQYRQLGSFDC